MITFRTLHRYTHIKIGVHIVASLHSDGRILNAAHLNRAIVDIVARSRLHTNVRDDDVRYGRLQLLATIGQLRFAGTPLVAIDDQVTVAECRNFKH